MKTHSLKHISFVLTLLVLTALACNTLTGAEPVATQEPPVATIDDEPTEVIIGLDTEEPEATESVESGDTGEPLVGDCTSEINPNGEIVLQVTEGISEIQDEQFISVAGEVTNPTDQWVWATLVWVRMCDENGQLLHIESEHTYPTQIPPGGTVPFHVFRDVANTQSQTIPSQYKIDALAVPGDDSKQAELVNFTSSLDGNQLTVSGTFQNTGTAVCLSPTVVIAFYKDGQAYETQFLQPAEISEIAVGDSSEVSDYTFVPDGVTDTKFFTSCD